MLIRPLHLTGWWIWAPNSMDRAEIAMLVQESLGLTLSPVELFGPRNIGELADLFLQKINAA